MTTPGRPLTPDIIASILRHVRQEMAADLEAASVAAAKRLKKAHELAMRALEADLKGLGSTGLSSTIIERVAAGVEEALDGMDDDILDEGRQAQREGARAARTVAERVFDALKIARYAQPNAEGLLALIDIVDTPAYERWARGFGKAHGQNWRHGNTFSGRHITTRCGWCARRKWLPPGEDCTKSTAKIRES